IRIGVPGRGAFRLLVVIEDRLDYGPLSCRGIGNHILDGTCPLVIESVDIRPACHDSSPEIGDPRNGAVAYPQRQWHSALPGSRWPVAAIVPRAGPAVRWGNAPPGGAACVVTAPSTSATVPGLPMPGYGAIPEL